MAKRDETKALTRVADALTIQADGSLRVDVAGLDLPHNLYDADVASVELRNGAVSLFFGKCDMGDESQLRTRLELRFPIEAFVSHFWGNSRLFHAAVQEFGRNNKAPGIRPDPRVTHQSQQHSEWVNFNYIARTGTQAALDFYHISPPAIAQWKQNITSRHLRLEPKVRVLTTIWEVVRLLDACEPIVSEVEPMVKRMETNDA